MGGGLFLLVVGAILAFAVDDDMPGIDLGTVGLILMLAGAAVIAWARNGHERERVVTTTGTEADLGPSPLDPDVSVEPVGEQQTQVVHEVVRERGPEPRHG
jgi:hypothetical protein